MNNNTTISSIEELIEKTEDYGKTSLELFKLHLIDKTSEVISYLISQVVIFFIVVLFILILNIGLSLWIGEILGKTYYGFFALSGFYVVVAVILYASRNKLLKQPSKNSIIVQMQKIK
jgi:hypothetical protein